MRGGKRVGAGRKSKVVVRAKARFAEKVLADKSFSEKDAWLLLLNATQVTSVAVVGGEDGEREQITIPDLRIRLDTLKFLTEQRDGKAPQAVAITDPDGGAPQFRVIVEHVGPAHKASTKAI